MEFEAKCKLLKDYTFSANNFAKGVKKSGDSVDGFCPFGRLTFTLIRNLEAEKSRSA